MESLRESRKRSLDRASKGLDSEDDDDNDAIMVTPKRRRSQGGMAEILKDAMKVKRQANEIRQKLKTGAESGGIETKPDLPLKYPGETATVSATTAGNEPNIFKYTG